jgi:hypothetical protein
MTNQGYDYLELIRRDTIWEKVKETGTKLGTGMTTGIIRDLATKYIKKGTCRFDRRCHWLTSLRMDLSTADPNTR